MEVIWSEEEQKFITIPDGDIATHRQIYDYYLAHRSVVLYADGEAVCRMEDSHIPHLD